MSGLVQRVKAGRAYSHFRHYALGAWCYARDWRWSVRTMNWLERSASSHWKHSARLLYEYHKLEKGLSIGGPQRFFGLLPLFDGRLEIGFRFAFGFDGANRF